MPQRLGIAGLKDIAPSYKIKKRSLKPLTQVLVTFHIACPHPSRWASNPRPVGQDSTKNVGRCISLTRLPKRHLPNPKSPPNPCFTARCGSLAGPRWVSRRERSCNKRTGYRLDSVHRLSASQHPEGTKKTNGQNPVWTYLLVDPPNLLLSQVHFSGGRASQNAELPRLAEKTVYLQGEETGEQASNTRPRRQAGGVSRG